MGVLPSVCFLVVAVASASCYACLLRFLYVYSEVQTLTTAQYSMAVVYGFIVAAWSGAEAGFFAAKLQPRYDSIAEDEQDLVSESEKAKEGSELASPNGHASDMSICGIKQAYLPALRSAAEFAAIMGFLYLCDRTTLVAKGPKYVNKTAFWAVNGAILLLACFTIRGGKPSPNDPVDGHVKPLQRDQTEEWKGAPCRRRNAAAATLPPPPPRRRRRAARTGAPRLLSHARERPARGHALSQAGCRSCSCCTTTLRRRRSTTRSACTSRRTCG